MKDPGKGILAADESTATITKRFRASEFPCTEETRRAYREMLFTTPSLGDFVGGVILYDETIRQKTRDDIMIRKLKSGGYRLYSRKRNPKTGRRRNLGTFATLAATRRHEREVQFFKKRG